MSICNICKIINKYNLIPHRLINGGYFKEVARNKQYSIILYLQIGTQQTASRIYKKPSIETVLWIEGDDLYLIDGDKHIILNSDNPSYTIKHDRNKIYNYYHAPRGRLGYTLTTVTVSPPFDQKNLIYP